MWQKLVVLVVIMSSVELSGVFCSNGRTLRKLNFRKGRLPDPRMYHNNSPNYYAAANPANQYTAQQQPTTSGSLRNQAYNQPALEMNNMATSNGNFEIPFANPQTGTYTPQSSPQSFNGNNRLGYVNRQLPYTQDQMQPNQMIRHPHNSAYMAKNVQQNPGYRRQTLNTNDSNESANIEIEANQMNGQEPNVANQPIENMVEQNPVHHFPTQYPLRSGLESPPTSNPYDANESGQFNSEENQEFQIPPFNNGISSNPQIANKDKNDSIFLKVFTGARGLEVTTLDNPELPNKALYGNLLEGEIEGNEVPKVIVDVDGGVDDYQALVILLDAHHKGSVLILAITCTAGNTHVTNCIDNVFRLLETTGLLYVPVYAGVSEQLIVNSTIKEPHIFGGDGFGDIIWQKKPYSKLVQKENAPTALINIVKQHPNKVTIFALAPLTNIALAIKLCNHFTDYVKQIYIVGGNFKSRHADFSTLFDPEAAHIVFEKSTIPLIILPWDTCQETHFNINWYNENLNTIPQNPVLDMLLKAEEKVYQGYAKNEKWYSCDPKAVFSFLYPDEFVKGQVQIPNVHVELYDAYKRGRIIYDQQPLISPMTVETGNSSITWITQIDQDFYISAFKQAFEDICTSDKGCINVF